MAISEGNHVRWLLVAIALIGCAAVVVGCCCAHSKVDRSIQSEGAPAPLRSAFEELEPPPGTPAPDSTTIVEMRNVHFRIDPRLPLRIQRLSGRMRPLPGFDVIDFGNAESFEIDITAAEVGLTPEDMRYLFNQFVFNYPDAPLTLHAMSIEDGHVVQRGTLRKIVDIPFEMTAEITATEDGRIRLHPVSMKICNIPGKGLMDALGIELEDLLDLSRAPGMEAQANDLLVDPEKFLPPPSIRGRISEVRVEDDLVIQVFDSGESIDVPEPSDPDAANYMFFHGGTLQFGKLFMVKADLQIVDEDPDDPFDFFLAAYLEQLVAGVSRTMPDAGLIAVFPDYDDLESRPEGSGTINPSTRP